MIILKSEVNYNKEEIEGIEKELSNKMKDEVVILPKGLTILGEIRSNPRNVISNQINRDAKESM